MSWFDWGRKTRVTASFEPHAADSASMTGKLLGLSDVSRISAVTKLCMPQQPNEGIMLLTACANLENYLDLARERLSREGHSADLFGFMRFVEKLYVEKSTGRQTDTAELSKRRLLWFLYAAYLKHAADLADKRGEGHAELAALWIKLADCAPMAEGALRHNIVWQDFEKAHLLNLSSDKLVRQVILQTIMPKWLQRHPAIAEYAEDHGIFLLPL